MGGQSVAVHYLLPFTVAMIMLAMGLGLVVDDFRRIVEKPKAVLVGLGSQLLLLPLLGFVVVVVFQVPPDLALGIVLLTACPGGAHSNLYSSLARADVALSVTLTAVAGFITIVTIPPILRLATWAFTTKGQVPEIPIGETTLQILLIMGVPVVIGMLIRAKGPRWAAALENWVRLLAIALLAIIVLGSILRQSDNVVAFAKLAGVPVLVLNLLAMLLGYASARAARLPPAQQRTITLEVGIQNGALAFALAAGLLDSLAVAIPAILYSILVYFTGLIVVVLGRQEE